MFFQVRCFCFILFPRSWGRIASILTVAVFCFSSALVRFITNAFLDTEVRVMLKTEAHVQKE